MSFMENISDIKACIRFLKKAAKASGTFSDRERRAFVDTVVALRPLVSGL